MTDTEKWLAEVEKLIREDLLASGGRENVEVALDFSWRLTLKPPAVKEFLSWDENPKGEVK